MKKMLSVLLTLAVLLSLTACGGASTSTMAYKAESAAAAPMEDVVAEEMAMDAGSGLQTNGQAVEAEMPQNRKWVVTVFLSAETEDLDPMMDTLNQQIQDVGGYVENQSVYNGSSRNEHRYRNANLTIRVPAEKVDFFVSEVASFSNVVSQEQTKDDITLTYVATQSRMQALETEQTRLLELLAQAETMEDLLTIEARLTEVRTELENVTSRMRLYDNQVDYATIHLGIQEVRQYTPVEEPGFFERISRTFSNSLEGLSDGAVDVTVWVLGNSPYLVVLGGLLLLLRFLAKKLSKGKKRGKKQKKADPFAGPIEIPTEVSSEE